ncbi:MAG: sugar ABC transporter permease [Treponema sp.]|jgi:multiple sugar transport system permease protein|nr:sugar ABC transporter permease [Treponema sp.]
MLKNKKQINWLWGFLFIAPLTLGLYIFFLYPMVYSIFISFNKWNHLSLPEFTGIANYIRLFHDGGILREFFNTLFFVAAMVPCIIIVSLLLANTLNKPSPFNGYFRTVFFLPYVMLPVVSAQVWMIIFNSRYGILNALLKVFHLPQPVWFANEWLVRIIIIIVGLWASVGYYAIIILAGLQNIPQQYYEACDLDGGSSWHKFIHITVPLVTPQLFYAAVVAVISIFKMFDYIFVFGKSNNFVLENLRTMAFGIYERGFTFLEMGYASAEAMALCIIVLVVTVVQQIGQKKWVHYS